ncbi:hypothetical protein DLJ46_29140 [Micromonospora globispora]|uniref:Uncharacterized protein n=1 Tax=Micromonospora globispora TaxID=1450148 RepID=A0A317JSR0_9ACTN|nr:hypothetical protein [Micromonospora globispora]PWU43867.1 hypothetical protein DLJ46_29140 [Micromonospora globispora]RQW97540.1 hypothetical protein DKL51_11955 [Micromonospora globispora]
MTADRERFVIHLPVRAGDLGGAVRLARVVARWASLLSPADPGETTVSAEDEQGIRHRVFCDLLLPGGRRCLLRADHDGPCARRLTR